jgi:hypothetical protein
MVAEYNIFGPGIVLRRAPIIAGLFWKLNLEGNVNTFLAIGQAHVAVMIRLGYRR